MEWKKKIIVVFLIYILLLLLEFFIFSTKISYLETAYMTYGADDVITVRDDNMMIEQGFEMPYDIIESVSLKIGNFQRDSNSRWNLQLVTNEGKIIVSKEFGFYDASDNHDYKVHFGRKIRVEQGAFYWIKIQPVTVEEGNKIGFYIGNMPTEFSESSSLIINGVPTSGMMFLIINGGEQDYFWCIVYGLILTILAYVAVRAILLKKKGLLWYEDTVIHSILVGIAVFLVYIPFASTSVCEIFTDENDNIRGGMIIANGGVLYRDYVVQHPPVGYYVCGIFALLGAKSVEQMRILFYILLGLVWALMYVRYNKEFGKKIMTFLPVVIMLCTKSLIGSYSTMILSDVIQQITMVLLLLELISYCRNRTLKLSRILVISLGIWITFGCAFISVYSIFFFILVFIIVEVYVWKKKTVTLKGIAARYLPLLIIGVTPAVAAMVYFGLNHTLYECYRQMYLFNREVYVQYQSIGRNLFEPFLSGLSSMFSQYVTGLLAIGGKTELSVYNIMTIALVTGYMLYAIKKVAENKKNIAIYSLLTLMIAAGAARGVSEFHGLAFWGMMIAWLIVIPVKEYQVFTLGRGLKKVLLAGGFCLLIEPYISAVSANISAEQATVSFTETMILSHTEPGEQIFIDAFALDSIYLLNKDRDPANRAVYCLPWYMDWYEEWNLEDLKEKSPKVAVFHPDIQTWGRTYYMMRIHDYITANYTRISDDSILWVKNE